MIKLIDKFKNPSVEYKGMPFWSWNGLLDKNEIKRQVGIFKEMGFGGFFIHSRIGIVTEYLGEEWFECVSVAVEEAEKNGLIVYIYDEDRWPSGSCGGIATMLPAFRQKSLSIKLIPDTEFSFSNVGQEFVRAFAVKLDNGILVDYFPYDYPQHIPEGYSIAAVTIVEMAKHNFYNGYTYLDTLNKDATEHFIMDVTLRS